MSCSWGEIAVQQKHIYSICQSSCFKHADLLWTFSHKAALLSCVYFSLWFLPFSGFWIMCLIWSFSKLMQFFFHSLFLFLGCVVTEFSRGRHRANLDTACSENHIMTSWKESAMATPEPAVNADLFQTTLDPPSSARCPPLPSLLSMQGPKWTLT